MKVLRFKKITRTPNASSKSVDGKISDQTASALRSTLHVLSEALRGEEFAEKLGGKSLVSWQDGESIRFGVIEGEKGLSSSVQPLVAPSEDVGEHDYPIAGYRLAGKSLTIATEALTVRAPSEFAEFVAKGGKFDENRHPRANDGRFGSGAGRGSNDKEKPSRGKPSNEPPRERKWGAGSPKDSAKDTYDKLDSGKLDEQAMDILDGDPDEWIPKLYELANKYIGNEMPLTDEHTRGVGQWVNDWVQRGSEHKEMMEEEEDEDADEEKVIDIPATVVAQVMHAVLTKGLDEDAESPDWAKLSSLSTEETFDALEKAEVDKIPAVQKIIKDNGGDDDASFAVLNQLAKHMWDSQPKEDKNSAKKDYQSSERKKTERPNEQEEGSVEAVVSELEDDDDLHEAAMEILQGELDTWLPKLHALAVDHIETGGPLTDNDILAVSEWVNNWIQSAKPSNKNDKDKKKEKGGKSTRTEQIASCTRLSRSVDLLSSELDELDTEGARFLAITSALQAITEELSAVRKIDYPTLTDKSNAYDYLRWIGSWNRDYDTAYQGKLSSEDVLRTNSLAVRLRKLVGYAGESGTKGKRDVSKEKRDSNGRWTAGGDSAPPKKPTYQERYDAATDRLNKAKKELAKFTTPALGDKYRRTLERMHRKLTNRYPFSYPAKLTDVANHIQETNVLNEEDWARDFMDAANDIAGDDGTREDGYSRELDEAHGEAAYDFVKMAMARAIVDSIKRNPKRTR